MNVVQEIERIKTKEASVGIFGGSKVLYIFLFSPYLPLTVLKTGVMA
jgi:hypothetical protein